MTLPCNLFHFFRRYPVLGDVADIVQVPLEPAKTIQHNPSIYATCIYSQDDCLAIPGSRKAPGHRR